MPILAAEPECFPDCLLSDRKLSAENGALWWVAQTKPRQEKCLARHLQAKEIFHYLPTISRRRNHRGRIRTARLPLFPGYLFLQVDYRQRTVALASNRIVRYLEVADQDRLWNDLRQIRHLISSGLPITPESRIAVGTPVEVISGPLAGLRGTVERLATGQRFFVQIDFIEKGASVLIDDYALAPTDALVESQTKNKLGRSLKPTRLAHRMSPRPKM